jgi:hypothetical protein
MKGSAVAEQHFTVPLIVAEEEGIGRVNEPVTVGIPWPKGQLYEPASLALHHDNGKRLPLQTEVLARWSDGSVQWLLVDFLATVAPQTTVTYTLQPGPVSEATDQETPLRVHEVSNTLVVDSGAARFSLDLRHFAPLQQIMIEGQPILAATGSRLELLDTTEQLYQPHIRQWALETTGPVRATVYFRGQFLGPRNDALVDFMARLNFYACSSLVVMQFTVHNPRAAVHPGGLWDLGDAGSVYFRDLAFALPLQSPHPVTPAWSLSPHTLLTSGTATAFVCYQESSGGVNWRSRNHVNRHGQVMATFQGYRVTVDDALVQEGQRALPIIGVGAGTTRVVAALAQFWQNFPKALEITRNTLTLRLFPQQYQDGFELQGGEQKTHTVFMQFDHAQTDWPEVRWWHARLLPRTPPEWLAATQAIRYLTPGHAEQHADYQELVDTAITGEQTFFDRREVIDEYGWRHFGDFYADHEAVSHQGDSPLISHYNNQYDALYGALVQYARSGERRWFQLAADLARHVIDIDIYHTSADRPVYNHGLFWHTDHYTEAATATHRSYSHATSSAKGLLHYGGGPSNEHNYTTGLLHYYWLTGDRGARDAVGALADWVIQMDDGSTRRLGWLDRRPTGRSTSTASFDYQGPGRGAGNSLNALLDAAVLTGAPHYLATAEALIRRCIHPHDNIADRHLEDVEHRWSYTVFLQVLGKYLDYKLETGQLDLMYGYAQASLLHYAAWMFAHEVPYKQVLHKVEIPTETWPAQDIRKSVVFNLAAKHAPVPLRDAYLQRAAEFFHACITDLRSFATCRLTRPIVLLMANGYVQAYFNLHPEEAAPSPKATGDFGTPQTFRPQFYEAYQLRTALQTLQQTIRTLPQRWCRSR